MRQIILDTETTGLSPAEGHRIIEVAAVEMINRRLTGRHYHTYINPQRAVDAGAQAVHGLSTEFLADKPLFHAIATEFLAFIEGAELIIHNAPFDVSFLDSEFTRLQPALHPVTRYCRVLDTLVMARKKHPGQQNSLDALCRRYEVDNSHRELHGALLDANLLAAVYLAMTGGQASLFGEEVETDQRPAALTAAAQAANKSSAVPLKVIYAQADELTAHEARLAAIEKAAGQVVWKRSDD
jgi:DNA polymerase-3 subunit epsilon